MMNDRPSRDLRPADLDRWEARVAGAATTFPYPPTPDLVAGVGTRLHHGRASRQAGRSQRLGWVLAAVALVLAGLMAVPQVRAAVVEALQIGRIRILVAPPASTPVPPATTPPGAAAPGATAVPSATQSSSPTPLASVLDLAGETTLEEARRQAGFTIRTPAYPPDLGPPARVFRQDLGGPVVVLVWTVPGQPGRVRLSLHEFGPNTFAEKMQPRVVQETTVNGAPAAWTEGAHLFVIKSGDIVLRELVRGHTLIWQESNITYRLETDQDLPEAIRIAESLH